MTRSPDGPPARLGVVLAAGAGRRFGGPKISAAGGDWLRAAVSALRDGGCDRVAVCMGARLVDPPPGVLALEVPDWDDGMSASVRAALDLALDGDDNTLVLHLVDLPDVGADVVARVAAAAGDRPDALSRAAYAGRPGHPVALGRAHWEPMRTTLDGDNGGRNYLAAHAVHLVECGDLATGVDRDVPESTE